jgi:hypothetical protein
MNAERNALLLASLYKNSCVLTLMKLCITNSPKRTTNCKTDPEEGHSGECSFFLTCKGNETVPTAPLLSTHILHSPEFALYHLFLSPKFNFLLHRKKFHEPIVERMVSCSCEIQNTQIMDGNI